MSTQKKEKSRTHINNPLPKRLKRDLREDLGKYIVIFALLFVSIGFTSGFLVAADSMIVAYNESFEKYNVEDGHFTLQRPANKAQIKNVEANDIETYELFYAGFDLTNGSSLRVFKNRMEVNLPCVMEGRLPNKTGEIAIDRMYADNNKLSVGDTIAEKTHEGEGVASPREWNIVGLVALPDYSALFSDNNDLMFDSLMFGVALVSEDEFDSMHPLTYCYAWKYLNGISGSERYIENEKEISDDLMKKIGKEVTLEDFVPRYLNQGINFTGDDMGGDSAMMEVFLYIMIVITAFVYGITMKDTIGKESTVIGTLLASGYTKGELVRHYMTMPIIVTLVAAITGNIFGYTLFKNLCVALYYNSYSLPTYETLWNANAFVRTTLIPILIMGAVSWIVLRRSLSFSPMDFLRRNLTRQKNKSALKLSKRIPFFSRFRMRIIIQNIPNYLVLFIGIFFANVLLYFGMALPNVLTNYQDSIPNQMIAERQYILSIPSEAMDEDKKTESMVNLLKYFKEVETEIQSAEKFGAYTLETIPEGEGKKDEIMIYGIEDGSRYVDATFDSGEIYVSSLFADKYGTKAGDTLRLKEKYDEETYDFNIAGIVQYDGAMNIFMGLDDLNKKFDLPEGMFSGYFANEEITDISEEYINSIIDFDSLTKVSRQLMKSFGGFMKLVNVFSVVLFVFLVYLLSKIIIEKNGQSISMTKILGYTDGEVSRLYLVATTIAVIIFVLISFPIVNIIVRVLWQYFIALRMSGWIVFHVDVDIFFKMFALAICAYIVVAVMEFIKIKRIPMDIALKNVE